MFEAINIGYIIVPFIIGIRAYFPYCHINEKEYDSLTHLAWGLSAIGVGIVINLLTLLCYL